MAKNALDIIEQALIDAGATLADVVRTVTYVTDIADLHLAAWAHLEAFGEIRPAATIVEVSALDDPTGTIEIEVYAICTAPEPD